MWRIVGVGVFLAGLTLFPLAAVAADNPACSAALDLILSHSGKGKRAVALVVAGAPDTQETKNYTAESLAQADWSGDRPSAELVGAFIDLPPVGVLESCPGLSDSLTRERIQNGDDAVARITTTSGEIVDLPTYAASVLSLSLPVLSGDGHDALVEESICRGVNMCLGSIRHLQREKTGRWKVVGDLPTSSS